MTQQEHSDLVAAILTKFGARPGLRIWAQRTGAAKRRKGPFIRFGTPGQADISGVLAPSGRRVEIEVKTGSAVQSKEQRNWQAMIEKHGGLYVVARSVEDVERALSHD